ncbi:MAG TPA: dodecin family protein [Nitrososphaeraceae archaeon]|nr:dodecin family protein [Nitrososphaeraceae archaeon]
MVHVAKIVEIVGSSTKGWEDAAQVAVDEAKKTIHGIRGIEITDMTAKVDPNSARLKNIGLVSNSHLEWNIRKKLTEMG